jgi:hypothetical protein
MTKDQLIYILEATLDELEEHSIYAEDLRGGVKDTFDDFIEDYINSPNTIKVDCKEDMAIPMEDLQNNLQLLLDRHVVLEVSNLIEVLANTTPGENKDLHLGGTLIKVRP